LIAGVYGFDKRLNFCWFATQDISPRTVLLRTILTWDLWLFIALGYLIVAVATIVYSLCKKRGPFSGLALSTYPRRHPSQVRSTVSGVNPTLAATLARGEMARRALTVRVLGYIVAPVFSVFPTVIIDLLGRLAVRHTHPQATLLLAAITAGLMGTFNTLLLIFDPSVVAVVFWPHCQKRKEQQRRQKRIRSAQHLPSPQAPASASKPSALRNPEVGQTKSTEHETQDIVLTSLHYDHGIEFHDVHEITDLDISLTSTIGYDTEELAEIFHGL
jgi:hypothetical protein